MFILILILIIIISIIGNKASNEMDKIFEDENK